MENWCRARNEVGDDQHNGFKSRQHYYFSRVSENAGNYFPLLEDYF
jgi:hypothetical protein